MKTPAIEMQYKGIQGKNGEIIIGYFNFADANPPAVYCRGEKIKENTICGCTGIYDKNRNLLFENDIVKFSGEEHVIYRCATGAWGVRRLLDNDEGLYLSDVCGGCTLIGNIHEVPEVKPCPFCGKMPEISVEIDGSFGFKCDADGQKHRFYAYADNKAKAIKQWNQRQ